MARKDILKEEPEEHESYGLLQLSRVSCSPPRAMFGSSIRHGNFISLKICTGKKTRGYQKDWYGEGERLIEVEMSATQFAEAITSFNMGVGVPVTIDYVKGDTLKGDTKRYREECPEVNFRRQANNELKNEMGELSERVEELSKDAKEILGRSGTIKKAEKVKLLQDLMFLSQEIRSNIPFAHDCFNEAVDKTITEAKGEVDACYQTLRERLGDKAIAEGVLEVPLLDEPEGEEK